MKIKQILGKPVREEKEQNCPEFCLPKCYIGLEYEWEKTQNWENTNEIASYFRWHGDGSLRNNGREFVFNGPLSGTQLLKAIDVMDETARKFKFEASYRTSLHCHLDMTEMNFPDDIYLMGGLYCLTEPLLYKFVGNNRDSCNYCIPWYSHPQHYHIFLNAVANKFNEPQQYAVYLQKSKQYKYSGLNFFSLGDFGTVEWRHAPVNMQRDKILKWINIIMRHKKFVQEHQKVAIDWLLTYAQRRGPVAFLTEVFDTDVRDLLKNSRSYQADFDLGMETAYHYLTIMKGAR